MEIKVFDSKRDAEEWRICLQALPKELQDIYFSPEYINLHVDEPGTRGLMFIARLGSEIWCYPFMLREISCVGKEKYEFSEKMFDIESAYGYGGPLTSSKDRDFVASANEAFVEWCKNNHVIAEFIRFHPVIQNQNWFSSDAAIEYDRDTVSIDLGTITESGLKVDQKTRNIFRRAEKSGLCVLEYSTVSRFDMFVDLYLSTMKRLGSDDYYLFNNKYFHDLQELVSTRGWLYVAELDGKWIAASIFLKGRRSLHYHLSASDANNRIPGSTNVLISHAAKRGHELGYSRLHLGGGRSTAPDDSLLTFKRKMGTDVHSFFIGKRIHDSEAYSTVCKTWKTEYPHLSEIHGNKLLCYRYSN